MVARFFDIERLLHTIDDDNLLDIKAKAKYDESDDEEDVVLRKNGEDLNLPPRSIIPSSSLPLEGDEHINTGAEELCELLSDGLIAKKSKATISATKALTNYDSGDDVDVGKNCVITCLSEN